MKKTAFCVTLVSAFCAAPVMADIMTHCPQAADVKISSTSGHPHGTSGATTYDDVMTPFFSVYFIRDQSVAYFKEAWYEPAEQNKNELHMHCVYVYQDGRLADLKPIYPNIWFPEHVSSGVVGDRWIYDNGNSSRKGKVCNSQNPVDCLFYLK